MRMKPAVFLDRDGVINIDRDDYVKSWDEFVFLPGVPEALARLHEARREVYIITNQAGGERGKMTEAALQDIFLRMQVSVRRHGGMIHGIEACLHHPDTCCQCRKPEPGMFLKAAVKHGIDLQRSVFVGDRCTDMDAARRVGCTTVFVCTRTPEQVDDHLHRCSAPPDIVAPDLPSAVEDLITLTSPRE